MKKTAKRYLALVLAVMMLLPLITVPTFAADPWIWRQDFEHATQSALSAYAPDTKVQASTTDPNNRVVHEAVQLYAGNTTDYYLVDRSTLAYAKITGMIDISGTTATLQSGKTVTLSWTSNKVDYSETLTAFSGTINKTKYEKTVTYTDSNGSSENATLGNDLYVINHALYDGLNGGNNIAKIHRFAASAYGYDDFGDDGIVFSTDIYFSTNFKSPNVITIGAYYYKKGTTSGSTFEMFGFQNKTVNDVNVIELKKANGSTITSGSGYTMSVGVWHNVTAVINKETGNSWDVYIDGELATSFSKSSALNSQVDLQANSVFFQINRRVYDASTLAGYVEYDNLTYYYDLAQAGIGVSASDTLFSQNFENTTVANAFSGYTPSQIKTSVTDSSNSVAHLDLIPEATEAYCVIKSDAKSHWSLDSGYEIINGVLTGQVTVDSVTYNITGAVNYEKCLVTAAVTDASGEASSALGTVYVAAGEICDRIFISANCGKPSYLKHSAIQNEDLTDGLVISADFLLADGTVGTLATQITGRYVSAGTVNGNSVAAGSKRNIQPYVITAKGDVATLGLNTNQVWVDGAAVDFELGVWNNITVVIDKETSEASVYLNGVYAFRCKNKDGTGQYNLVGAPVNYDANSFLYQLNRYNSIGADVNDVCGYAQVDNVVFYNGTSGLSLKDQELLWKEDYEGDVSLTAPLKALASPTNASNTALFVPGYISESYSEDRYFLMYNNNWISEITSFEVSADGNTLTAKQDVTVRVGTDSNKKAINKTFAAGFSGTINKDAHSTFITLKCNDSADTTDYKLYICNGPARAAWAGDGELLAARKDITSAAIKDASAREFVISFELYLTEGFKVRNQVPSIDVYTDAGFSTAKELRPFDIHADGTHAWLTNNVDSTKGTTYEGDSDSYYLSLGKWYDLTMVMTRTGDITIYIDGVIALSLQAKYTTITGIVQNTLAFENERGGTASAWGAVGTGIYIDDLCFYSNRDAVSTNYYVQDFADYATSWGSGVGYGSAPMTTATYVSDPAGSGFTAVKMPFGIDKTLANGDMLWQGAGSGLTYIKDTAGAAHNVKYLTVTGTDGDGVPTVSGYTVTDLGDGKYEATNGTYTYTDLMKGTIHQYLSYHGDSKALNTNWRVPSSQVDYTNEETVVVGGDYYIESGSIGIFESQFYSILADGATVSWFELYRVYAESGDVYLAHNDPCGTKIIYDAWNSIRLILNLRTGYMKLYLNGALVDECDSGYTNISLVGGNWIPLKQPRFSTNQYNRYTGNAYVTNLSIMSSDYYGVESYDASNLLYVEVDGVKNYTANEYYLGGAETIEPVYLLDSDYRHMLTTEQANQIRLKADGSGLRFATKVDMEKLNSLYALLDAGDVADVEIGTLIAPALYLDYVTRNPSYRANFTIEALEAAGYPGLLVQATRDKYYSFDDDDSTTHFVGSIVNIREENISRDFMGRGYVKVTLKNGNAVTFYSEIPQSESVQHAATRLLATNHGLSGEKLEIVQAFANGNAALPEGSEKIQGLNVLAIGDSLFNGHSLEYNETWLALLARRYSWNFTNLGMDGWTVASTANSNVSGSRGSIYDALFHSGENLKEDGANGYNYTGIDYVYNSSYTGTNRFYNYGSTASVANTEVDLILLEGGTNDYGYKEGIALGTLDSTDEKTVYGAWNAIVERLHEVYPNAKIVFVTAWHQDSYPDRMDYNVNSLKALAEKWNAVDGYDVACLDAGDPAISGINMMDANFRAQYSLDTYATANHLNAAGMQIAANNLQYELIALMPESN